MRERGAVFRRIALIAALVGACTTAPPMPGRVLVAQAPVSGPPVSAPCAGGAAFFWVGEDERGVHHDARVWRPDGAGGVLSDRVTLPLPPQAPHALTAFAGVEERCVLVWRDRGAAGPDDTGSPRLYAAVLDRDLRVLRGPVAVSPAADDPAVSALAYAGLRLPDGRIALAWTGGLPGEPGLFTSVLDGEGRPSAPQAHAWGAAVPVWQPVAGGYRLWWTDPADGQVYASAWSPGAAAEAPQPRGARPALRPGDWIETAAFSADGAALVWHVQRASGAREVWRSLLTADGALMPPEPAGARSAFPAVAVFAHGQAGAVGCARWQPGETAASLYITSVVAASGSAPDAACGS
jgi:hypothetical protein